jgi:putative isomerase
MDISPRSRQLYDELAWGWNTWDVRSVTTHVFLPHRVGVSINFFIPASSHYIHDLAWDEVESFGEHSVDGTYTELTARIRGNHFRVQTSAKGQSLVIKVSPVGKVQPMIYVAAEVALLWGKRGRIKTQGSEVIVEVDKTTYRVTSLTIEERPAWNPCRGANLVFPADSTVYLQVDPVLPIFLRPQTPGEIDVRLNQAQASWLARTISAEGDLGEGVAAMRRSLLWNTIFEPHHDRVLSPVSRNWCRNPHSFGDYVVFGWDTFFAALMFGHIDKRLAYANFFAMLEEITPEGMVPNFGSGTGCSRDRSEPQVGAWCAWKLYLQHDDRWFIEEVFDRLLEWNRWRFANRDGNGDGLLELASTPWEEDHPWNAWKSRQVGEKQGAMWESGLDNSPMWDDAVFNDEKHCLELSYVGLNALMVADCECLEKMAKLLGREVERRELEERRLKLAELINLELWDEGRGIYLNKDWQGKFNPSLSPTHFYPLIAGIADEDRIARLAAHLQDPDEFWGEYMLPTVSRDDPAFQEQHYWRGRVWAPTNFLVVEGLRRVGLTEMVSAIVKSGFEMFMRCWKERGVVGENYNAITGEAAEGNAASDRFYHWGALLVYMMLQEFEDYQTWDDRVVRS